MTTITRISVILPSFNQGHILLRVLDNLAKQNINRSILEVIIVDDGSEDNTKMIVSQYLKRNSLRCRYLQQKNAGAAAARNRGAKAAKGDILLFLDADVIPDVNTIREHLEFHYVYYRKTDVALGRVEMSPELRTRNQIRQNETRMKFDIHEITAIPWYLFRSNNISFKRDFFIESGGFDDTMGAASCEDTELAFRLHDRHMFLFYIGYALAYHYHPMDVQQFMRKAAAYGASMAAWYKKEPRARQFITHYYGLPAKEISPVRAVKYIVHTVLFSGVAFSAWLKLAGISRKLSVPFSEFIYEQLYKAHYRCTFRQHLVDGKILFVCAGYPRIAKQLSTK